MLQGWTSNYLIFSDVHLGADLVQHVRPWTVSRLKQVARIDRHLGAMLDWYRKNADPERPWRLVIAGDLVDFIGMSIAPRGETELETALTPEELHHGLGSAHDHAAVKLRAVAARHSLVFERLATFVAEGHSLVLVRGNHDLDFHWETARRAFIAELVVRATHLEPAVIESRVEFCPWFYYVEGLLYVEHGHQWDAMCNYGHLLAPLSPRDPRRLNRSFSDVLLRSVVTPTLGLDSEGHQDRGPLDYVRMTLKMGFRGAVALALRYGHAIAEGLRNRYASFRGATRHLKQMHEKQIDELAARWRVRAEILRTLAAAWPRPVGQGVLGVLRSVFLDRILGGALSVIAIAALVWGLPGLWSGPLSGVLLAAAVVFFIWSKRARGRELDPTGPMRKAAQAITSLLPTRWIVMGHSHEPCVETLPSGSTYVNVGHWDETDEGRPLGVAAPRTHLVIRWIDGIPRASFCRWDPELGPLEQAPIPS